MWGAMKQYNATSLQRSPWGDSEEDKDESQNLFTRKRRQSFDFNNFNFNLNGKIIFLLLSGIFAFWVGSGIYEVSEGEQAAVMRFGKFNRTGMPGLNYHLPKPIEYTIIEKVNQSRRIEIGYRSSGKNFKKDGDVYRDVPAESIMLTGDENIIELNADVMWSIYDLSEYIFNVVDQQETVKAAAESAIREVIGDTLISYVLSNQKQEITSRIENLIQQTLAHYKIGVKVEQVQLLKAEPPREVIQAYRDVQTAKADKEKSINEAQAYSNDILPKARGDAAKMLAESEGYKEEVVAKAKGDIARFDYVYAQYVDYKDITKTRIYLDTIQEILSNTNKVVLGVDGVLPHMQIGENGFVLK